MVERGKKRRNDPAQVNNLKEEQGGIILMASPSVVSSLTVAIDNCVMTAVCSFVLVD